MTTKQLSSLLYLNVASIPKLVDLLIQSRFNINRLRSWSFNGQVIDDLTQNIQSNEKEIKKAETRVEKYCFLTTGASD